MKMTTKIKCLVCDKLVDIDFYHGEKLVFCSIDHALQWFNSKKSGERPFTFDKKDIRGDDENQRV